MYQNVFVSLARPSLRVTALFSSSIFPLKSVFSSFHELMQSRGVRLSVRLNFAQITSSTIEMAGSPPNLQVMVVRCVCIQDVLKVKGHKIRTLL